MKETLSSILGDAAALRTELAIVEADVNRKKMDLAAFQVLPQYRELESEASQLSAIVAQLSNQNTIDKRRIEALEAALAKETPPKSENIVAVYKEAGLVVADRALKKLSDVEAFHNSVIENRRSYLSGEIAAARLRLSKRATEQNGVGKRLGEVMQILNTHKALDQFSLLQSEVARLQGRQEALKQQLESAESLSATKAEIKIDKSKLFRRLQQDFKEQSSKLSAAINAFQTVSKQLYEQPGQLNIKESESGPKFEIIIHGKRSKGISNMQIFCFDMMLMQLGSMQHTGPGFLIHDSHLFDGVDERQVATALRVGSELSKQLGFQYIVTLNSDALPKATENFDPNQFVIPQRLSDATETGGLYGIRFN
jgi:uncharacterized protein YydD (DUF2326 family)